MILLLLVDSGKDRALLLWPWKDNPRNKRIYNLRETIWLVQKTEPKDF